MRGRSSSKQGKITRVIGVSMENHKVDKVKQQPHLSGAYIRSLVKHLTSTRTKDSFNGGDEKLPLTLNINGEESFRNIDHNNNMQQESPPPQPPPPPPPKKQVRRRQHTTKPYQERLLNMAEARREIVTALKFHRASMKQQKASNNHDFQSQLEEGKLKSKRNTRAYATIAGATTAAAAATTTTTNSSDLNFPYYWPISKISPPPLPPPYHENINFILPNQTLGLNLNFHDFKTLGANLYHNPLSNNSTSSSSSSSSSSCPSTSFSAVISAAPPEEVVATSTATTSSSSGGGLHHAMDDDEMEEIRSLGEQHQMEWNDTVNLMTSARWFEFLNTIEGGQDDGNHTHTHTHDYDACDSFDQIM